MPPTTKRKVQIQNNLEKARETKTTCGCSESLSQEALIEVRSELDEPSLTKLASMTEEALNTDDEEVDPSFDLDSSMKSETGHVIDQFCDEWVCQLDTDDRVSLGIFLSFQLPKLLDVGQTKAAELASIMVGKSDRIIHEWRAHF